MEELQRCERKSYRERRQPMRGIRLAPGGVCIKGKGGKNVGRIPGHMMRTEGAGRDKICTGKKEPRGWNLNQPQQRAEERENEKKC